MPVKSVIDIDLNSSEFSRFKELFDRYSETLAKTPAMWKASSKEQQAMAGSFERQTAAILAQVAVHKESDDADKKRLERLTTTDRLWTNISHSSGTIAKNVLDIGAGVLKWGSIIGGGLLGGSLFGLDRLGHSTSNERRSSMGLGLSIGQQQAFGTNFSRFVDPGSFLSGINSAVSDLSKQGPLYALGVNPNQSTEEVALATLRAVRQKALGVPVNQLGILESSFGLGNLGISTEDLRRLRSTSSDEFNSQLAHYGQDVRSFNIDDPTAKKWQNFTTQLSRAGETIQKIFVDGLGPLTTPLEHLSAALVKTVGTMMEKGGPIEHGINDLAKWIENFSAKVATDNFQRGVDNFMQAVGDMASVLHHLAHPYDSAVNAASRGIESGINAVSGFFGGSKSGEVDWAARVRATHSKADYLQLIAETERQFKLPPGILRNQWKMESGDSFNPGTSKAGAVGPFQFLPATAKELGIDPMDPVQAVYGAGMTDARLRKKYHDDIGKMLAAYNYGEGNVDRALRSHPTDWQLYIPKETQNYIQGGMAQSGGVKVAKFYGVTTPGATR